VRFVVEELQDVRGLLDVARMTDTWPISAVSLRTPDELRDELGIVLDDRQWDRLGLTRRQLDLIDRSRQRQEGATDLPPSKAGLFGVEGALAAVEATLRSLGADPGPRFEWEPP
jgi:hypothetical protein